MLESTIIIVMIMVMFHSGRWAPSQTDVDSMVRSSTPTSQPASCMVVDMGAFNLVEFVKTLGLPAPGLSVTGGVHVLQILSHSLAARATVFAPLDATNKVCASCLTQQSRM